MVRIGEFNQLNVVKQVDFGVFLDGGRDGNILLPKRYVPASVSIGDKLDVFIYLDSEDQLIATTDTPLVRVGQCASLKVKDVNAYGAFLDWGLPKDLLVPFKEQTKPLRVGQSCVVYAYLDSSDRIVASTRLSRYLPEIGRHFKPGQAVDLLVSDKTSMGYKAVINNHYLGLIFRDDAFKPLRVGQRLKGYIKSLRDDGKIDVTTQLHNTRGRLELTEQILAHLRDNNGRSTLTDKSPPDLIYKQYNVSKATYKKALGALYKSRKIVITADLITLAEQQ